jgi:hypothetical protein
MMVVVAAVAAIFTLVAWTSRARPFPVSGTVSYNGLPLASGNIIFVPTGQTGQQAAGPIIGGKYALSTFATSDGALPGAYAIAIVSSSVPARYQSQTTSGLTALIQKSSNMIELYLQ